MSSRPNRTYTRLAQTLSVNLEQVSSAVSLFDEGNSVPFVARYRQEVTGCLSDTKLRKLYTELWTLDKLEAKRENVINELAQSKQLTENLMMEIDAAETEDALEEIHLPFIVEQVSKATLARQAGMEPLAQHLCEIDFTLTSAMKYAGDLPIEEALEYARAIIEDDIARLPYFKAKAEEILTSHGILMTTKTELASEMMNRHSGDQRKVPNGLSLTKQANDPRTYERYYGEKLRLNRIRAHQIFAIFRAEKLGFLTVKFHWVAAALLVECMDHVKNHYPHLKKDALDQIRQAAENATQNALKTTAEKNVRKALYDRAVDDATETFSRNLRSLLLTKPFAGATVMGIDPGFSHSCKLCVCDKQGTVLQTAKIYPHDRSHQKQKQAANVFMDLLLKYHVNAIALGNGVGSKETERFIYDTMQAAGMVVGWSIVSEDGASVYSASELASKELPDMNVSLRGAVSIARRLQDPLSELCKVNPSNLGIGLYQHDIEQSLLEAQLRGVVESAVNTVGVDLNTSSPSLLSYVAGLSTQLAQNIVQYRTQRSPFTNREQLKLVEGIDEKIFEQCAGFLRIPDGENALDNTSVHPESYFVVHRMLQNLNPDRMEEENVSLGDLDDLRNELLREEDINTHQLAYEIHVGVPTLMNIIDNILAPGRDIRGQADRTSLTVSISDKIENLKVGDQLSGVVKNVVGFGVFVGADNGITGLIRAERMRGDTNKHSRWVNPHDICKVGDRLQIEVIGVDLEQERVQFKLVSHKIQ